MSADRQVASDGRPVVSHTWGWSVIASPCHVPIQHFDVRHGARDRPLPTTSTDCPTVSDGGGHGDSAAHHPGADWPLCLPGWGCAPCSPLPQPFCTVSGTPPPALLIDRWGPVIGQEQHQGPAGDLSPSPLCTPAGDPTPVMPVKDTYSGKIESLDRDLETTILNPGMQFPCY